MANDLRYVRRRANGVFYYERRMPRAIIEHRDEWHRHFGGVPLFRKSLETRRQADAMRLGADVHQQFESLCAAILGGRALSAEEGDNATRPVTPEALQKISAEVSERTARPWARQVVLASSGGTFADELERMVGQREADADLLRAIVAPPGVDRDAARFAPFVSDPRLPNLAADVDRLVRRERLHAPDGSDARALITTAVREGLAAGQRQIDEILAGTTSAIPVQRFAQNAAATPKISEAVADYVGQLTAGRTIREVQNALASAVSVIGDLPLDEISRGDFIRFCQVEGARMVGGKDPKSIVRPMSSETLKKKVGLLRSAINHAIQLNRFSGPNPAANIDTRHFTKPVPMAQMPRKRPFSVHELELILKHPWFTGCASETNTHHPGEYRLTGAPYWAPILALYTGCRAGELGGLRISEIRLDHRHPHFVIQDNEYRTTKGSYRRNVPVLDALLEHGFGEFVEMVASAGHDRLFADWKAPSGKIDASSTAWSNAGLIRAFNRTVLWQQLKGILSPGVRQEVTFHGFRGAFKRLLGRQEYGLPVNYVHEVIGHAKLAIDARYVQEIDIAETYPVVRHCRFDGLELPPAP